MKALIIVLIVIILILVGAIAYVLLGYGGQAPYDDDDDDDIIATFDPFTSTPEANLSPNANGETPSDPTNVQTPSSGNGSGNGSTPDASPDPSFDPNDTPTPEPTSQETEEQLTDRRNIMLMQAEEHYVAGRYAEALALLRKDPTLFNDDTARLEAEVLAAMG